MCRMNGGREGGEEKRSGGEDDTIRLQLGWEHRDRM